MIRNARISALAALLALTSAAPIMAQEPAATKPVLTPLSVTVTISRYQGEKRVSSLPYLLRLIQGERGPLSPAISNFRIGTKVPINSTIVGEKGPVPGLIYQDVGTNIDCQVWAPTEAGLFRLQITIDESSVYDDPKGQPQQVNRPTLRSFRTTNSIMLKDGQSAQLSNTPDRTTGEVVKVDVALAVAK